MSDLLAAAKRMVARDPLRITRDIDNITIEACLYCGSESNHTNDCLWAALARAVAVCESEGQRDVWIATARVIDVLWTAGDAAEEHGETLVFPHPEAGELLEAMNQLDAVIPESAQPTTGAAYVCGLITHLRARLVSEEATE